MPQVFRSIQRLAPVVAAGFMASALGCREDAELPTDPQSSPALVAESTAPLAFAQTTTGGQHTCGVTTANVAYCWGDNVMGQLGDGTTTVRHLPVPVRAGGLRFRQIQAGSFHTCALTTDDRAYCWGFNGFWGQLGDGTTTNRLTPVPVAGGLQFRAIRAGIRHSCGIAAGTGLVYCWGDNQFGQLGDGSETPHRLPGRVAGSLSFRQLSVADAQTCGTTTTNIGYCWGYNPYGQLGDGTTVKRLTPTAVAGGLRFNQVNTAGAFACGVTTDNRAYCWGDNFSGQLGDGTTTRRLTPTAVAGGLSFKGVSAGAGQACAVTPTDRAYCWGNNFYGQLGDGTTERRLTPVPVAGDRPFRFLSTGTHTCAVSSQNRAFCWGNNSSGQLGDGTTQRRLRPRAVAGG